jgi:AcrR family transcriptional regulator
MKPIALQPLQKNRKNLPQQFRSKKTVEILLDTTASLLEEVGFSSFTTNLLSERTGISVRAIYRYFPNKHALVMELALRLHNGWQTEREEYGETLLSDPKHDWKLVWSDYIDRFIAAVRDQKGSIAITQTMSSDPLLRELDNEIQAHYMQDIANSFLARNPKICTSDAQALSIILLQSARAVINSLLQADEKEAEQMLSMLKSMHLNLISEWI